MAPRWHHLARLALTLVSLVALSCARRAPDPWSEVPLGTDARFNGIWFSDRSNGWIAGGARDVAGGMLGRTRDGGCTWDIRSGVLASGGSGSWLGGINFRDTTNGLMVGSGGLVLLTSDGGREWRNARSGRSSAGDLVRLQMLDAFRGWAVGPSSVIGTEDGGETWTPRVSNTSESGYLSGNAVCFTDPSRGWLVGHGGRLMRTEDGGFHWQHVALALPPGNTPTLWDVTFADAAHGWVVGDDGTLFHTSDAGATWRRQVEGVPITRMLAKGEKPRPPDIIPGLDGGPSRLSLVRVAFADTARGFALGHYSDVAESIVLGTHDGGATWRTEHVARGQYLHALFVLDRRHAWAVGDRERTLPQVLLRYEASE